MKTYILFAIIAGCPNSLWGNFGAMSIGANTCSAIQNWTQAIGRER